MTTMVGLAGLVIAGGASSRFGGDKALALMGGRPLLAWALAALDAVCGQAAVSARPDGAVWNAAGGLGRRRLADDLRHPRGPLAGVAAGLAWAKSRGCSLLITVPVDAPRVGGPELERLIAAAIDAPAAFAASPGGPHPLCAAWSVDLEGPLRARLDAGEHPSVRAWFEEIGAARVAFADDAEFRNVNTRADLAALEAGLAAPPTSDA